MDLQWGAKDFTTIYTPTPETVTSTFVSLPFESQKNVICGWVIGKYDLGEPLFWTKWGMVRHITHVHGNGTIPNVTLRKFWQSKHWIKFTPSNITHTLSTVVKYICN